MKKVLKVLSFIFLISLFGFDVTNVWAAHAAEDNGLVQMSIKIGNKEIELQPSEENSSIYVGDGGFQQFSGGYKVIIEGILTDSENKVSEVFSSLDIYNEAGTMFHSSDKIIENKVVDGKTHFIITYSNIMSNSQMYSGTAIVGAFYFDIKTESQDGKENEYIAVLDNKQSSFDENSGYPILVEYVGVNNNETGEILSGDTEMINTSDSKYHYAVIPDDVNDFSIVVNRKQNKMETINFSAITKSCFYWMGIGNNHISVNGSSFQRFDVNSNIYQGKYSSPAIQAHKGLNVVNLSFMIGVPPIGMDLDWSTMPPVMKILDTDINVPGLDKSGNFKERYVLNIPYIFYWDGEETETVQSSDTSISEIKPVSFPENYVFPIEYKIALDKDTGDYILNIPKTSKNNKLLLGILPSSAGAQVNVIGNEKSEGGYFDDGKGECGNYYGINLEDPSIETDENENKIIKVEVTAPDGKSKEIHKIRVMRKSSECVLNSLSINGGSVDSLDEQLKSGEKSFILELDSDDGPLTFEDIQISDNASCTVNGEEIEGSAVTVNADDITRLEVTAEDGLNSTLYIFLHQKQDGALPYYSISDETKSLAKDILEGWYDRPEKDKKNLAGSWPIFMASATATEENNNLDGAAVNDVNKNTYNQPTDYARTILQLIITGENPYNYNDDKGNNLVEHLEKNWTGPYANTIWALMGLRAAGANIPDGLVDDVVGLAASDTFDLDMRAWALGAVADLVSPTKLASLVEGFRSTLITEGDEAGMFYNFWYKYANTISHGCVLEGMAAAGIDIEKVFAVSDTITPLKALQRYQLEDGSFWYDISHTESMWSKDAIIGLGDTVHGDNVWSRYALTLDKYDNLIDTAMECYGEDGSSITDETKRKALEDALNTANSARADAESIQGLGDEYYALYAAVADVDYTLVGQPQVRVCSYEESLQIDAVIESISKLEDLASVTKESVQTAGSAYEALGGDDAELKEKLQGYVTNKSILKKAEAYLNFSELVDVVGEVTLESGQAIQDAEAAYENLDVSYKDDQSFADKYQVLLDSRKVYDVLSAIAALPSEITLDDADTVESIRTSYDALTDDLKSKVSNASALIQAEKTIKDLKAVKSVEALIEELPSPDEVTAEDEAAILEAYSNYNLLTSEQKAMVNAELSEKLETVYSALDQAKKDAAAVKDVIDNIAKLENLDDVTLEDQEFIRNVRSLYDNLSSDALRSQVSNYDLLVAAEKKLETLAKENLLNKVENLPSPDELEGTKPDGSDIQMTEEILRAIADAVSTYQQMDDAQQKIFANENPDTYEKLMTLNTIAEQYEGYVNEVLAPIVARIAAFELPVTKFNLGEAGDLLTKYEANEDARTYLDSIVWEDGTKLVDKMAALKEQIGQVNEDLTQAAAVDAMIEKLPSEVTADNLSDVKAALEAIKTAYEALSEQAQEYVNDTGTWNTVESLVKNFEKSQENAEKVLEMMKDAVDEDAYELTSEEIITVLKSAQEAYDALTPAEQALIPADAVENMETLKEKISKTKTKDSSENNLVTYKGNIPWDVVIEIESVAQSDNSYTTLSGKLDTDKKASVMKVFEIKAYRVLADGTKTDFMVSGGLTFVVHTGNDLTGKTIVLAHLVDDGTVEYLDCKADGSDLTFTVKSLSAFAVGEVKTTSGTDDGDKDNNNNNNNNNHTNGSGNNSGSGNKSTSGSSNKKSSGSSNKSTTTGGSTGVPKTGDTLASQMDIMNLLVLAGSFILFACLKKKRENNR